jgi:hypothetical protein
MTQFDLSASPMRTAFTATPDFSAFTHVAPALRLDTFPAPGEIKPAGSLKARWALASEAMFLGKSAKVDSVNENILNHLIWYHSTGFTRPYPGENTVLPPEAFRTKEQE